MVYRILRLHDGSVQTRKPFITDTRYQFGLSDIWFEI